jgi:hypothetical protein
MSEESEDYRMFAIVGSVMTTFLFAGVFWFFSALLLALVDPLLAVLSVPLTLLYFVCHILIGSLFSALLEFLFDTLDSVYGFAGTSHWGNWSMPAKILIAAWWPVTGLLGVPAALAGILYGLPHQQPFCIQETNTVVPFLRRAA